MRLIIFVLIIGVLVVAGTIVLGNPKNERLKREFETYYIKRVLPQVQAILDPAGKAHEDCVERVRQGFRTTRKGC